MPSAEQPAGDVLRFGPFELDRAELELRRGGEVVPLTRKAFDTLSYLVANAQRLVTRDELIAAVWPDTIVEEGNLNWAISALRKALGPRPEGEWIQTVRGAGYRFLARVESVPRAGAGRRAAGQATVEPIAIPIAPALEPAGSAAPSASRSGRSRRTRALVATAASMLILVVAALWGWSRTATQPPRRSIAVLGFRNLSGHEDLNWLSVAVSEMVSADLAEGERLRPVPAEDIERAKLDLALPALDSLSKETLQRVRAQLGADLVVAGSYVRVGGEDGPLRVDLRLQDAKSGEVLATASRAGTQSDLFRLVNGATSEVRDHLGLPAPALTAPAAQTILPDDPGAARAYAEGLERLRLREYARAAEKFERALTLSPHFAMAHAGLAEARAALNDDRAEPEFLAAVRDSGALPARERTLLEARHALAAHDWDRGLAALQSIWRRDPADFESGAELVEAQLAASRLAEAEQTLDAVAQHAGTGVERARLELLRWSAQRRKSTQQELIAIARRAVDATLAIGAKSLSVQAYYGLAMSGYWASDAATLHEGLEKGEALARETDDPVYLGQFLDLRGLEIFYDPKQVAASEAYFEQARAIFHRNGALQREAYTLMRMVEAANRDGEFGRALELQSDMRSLCDAANNDRCRAWSSQMRSDLESTRGDLALARHFAEDALARFRKAGDTSGESVTLTDVYWICDLQGDAPAAIDAARAKLEMHRQQGDDLRISSDSNQLAMLLAENGRAAEALPLVTDGVAIAERLKVDVNVAAGRSTLARTLWELGRRDEALKTSRAAMDLLPAIQHEGTAYFVQINHAWLLLQAGHGDEGRPLVADLLHRAQASHDTGGELECQLLLAMIDRRGAHAESATATLEALADEARTKGFGKVARRARAELDPSSRPRG